MKTLGLIGNIILGIFMVYVINEEYSSSYHSVSWKENLSMLAVMTLITVNIINHVRFSDSKKEESFLWIWLTLYFKRKRLEEEVKTLEAQKKLGDLQHVKEEAPGH